MLHFLSLIWLWLTEHFQGLCDSVTSLYLQVSTVQSSPFWTKYCSSLHLYRYHHRATFETLYLQQHKEQVQNQDRWGMKPLVITVPPKPTLLQMHSGYKTLVEMCCCSWTYKWIDVSPQCSSVVQSCLVPVSGCQDVAEAQWDRLWVQVCPKGEAVPPTTDNQQLLLIWQKDTTMIM